MANSIVDTENPFFPNFDNFDDVSSTLSDREDFLLVLVSSSSGSTKQGRNQKRALTIIEACGIQPEVLDAADPANALVRDELCEMSGIRGVYPQFFLVQGDRTSFFADFAEVEHMNEEGTLAEWLSMELPIGKMSPKNNPFKEAKGSTRKTKTSDDRSSFSQSNGTQVHEYPSSSTTDDLLNVESVSKILDSFDTKCTIPDKQSRNREQHANENESKRDDDNKRISVRTISVTKEEWSDPMLLERYEDEILALEDFLHEEDEDEGERPQYPRRMGNRLEIPSTKLQKKLSSNQFDKSKSSEKKIRGDGRDFYREKRNSVSSISSTATTATISPTSSSSRSRSPERHRSDQKETVEDIPSDLTSITPFSYHKNKNSERDIPCIDTISSRTEAEQLLQAEVEELRLRCEKLTAERYIIEGQLKEVRERNKVEEEERSKDINTVGMIHKYQLQQTMRCGSCNKVFKSDPSSSHAPIISLSCGHSVCRSCCHKRLAVARRHRDEIIMNSSERLRNTISSDLFMCGMGDMSQVYASASFDHQLQQCEACPICHAPKAFRPGKLNVNESLRVVLKLLEN